jgi:TonB family protein
MIDRRARSRRILALGLGGALFGHAVGLALEDAFHRTEVPFGLVASGADVRDPDETGSVAPAPDPTAVISLDGIDLAALPLVVVPGPGDSAAFAGESPLPAASADLPGVTAADRGGGAAGGAVTWTGRRDPDQTALRAQLWNGSIDYRTPRSDLDRRAATSEAIARAPDKAFGDRQQRRRARAGEEVASVGDLPDGTGVGSGTTAWRDADPVFDAAAGKTTPARAEGSTRRAREAAMVDQGATAVDTRRHGKTGDDVAVAAASDQRDPDPYDLTPSRSGGGAGEGVRGDRTDDGALADGRGHGTGASRTHSAEGRGGASVIATRTDPYLRELLRLLDHEIVFPHDLALDLRSGRVIVALTLHADGSMTDLTVTRSSGYGGFDDELTRALRAVAPLGPVPSDLLAGHRSLRVMVPYTFRNPMIR